MTVFMIQYAHKGSAFQGWFNIKGFTTLEKAKAALLIEKAKKPDFMYTVNNYKIES